MSDKCIIKVYGERNTGTNYFDKLLEANTEAILLKGVVPDAINFIQKYIVPGDEWLRDMYFEKTYAKNFGWKHSRANVALIEQMLEAGYEVPKFVAIVKNPYSWLLSLYRRPYHNKLVKKKKLSFEDFLLYPWPVLRRENVGSAVNPVELWNQKCESYYELCRRFDGLLLKYEDMLIDPKRIIEKMVADFHCRLKQEEFINYDSSTKDPEKNSTDYKKYYLDEEWRRQISGKAIELANSFLDRQLMKNLGYYVL